MKAFKLVGGVAIAVGSYLADLAKEAVKTKLKEEMGLSSDDPKESGLKSLFKKRG